MSIICFSVIGNAAIGFGQPFGHVQGCGPHVVEKLAQPGQALGASTVEAASTHLPFGQKTGVAKYGEVLAYGGPCHVECRRYLPGGQLVVRDQAQDRATAGFRERAERPVRRGVVVAGQAHSPTWLPSGSVKTAIRPKPSGRSVGGSTRVPPSCSALSRQASRSSTRMYTLTLGPSPGACGEPMPPPIAPSPDWVSIREYPSISGPDSIFQPKSSA